MVRRDCLSIWQRYAWFAISCTYSHDQVLHGSLLLLVLLTVIEAPQVILRLLPLYVTCSFSMKTLNILIYLDFVVQSITTFQNSFRNYPTAHTILGQNSKVEPTLRRCACCALSLSIQHSDKKWHPTDALVGVVVSCLCPYDLFQQIPVVSNESKYTSVRIGTMHICELWPDGGSLNITFTSAKLLFSRWQRWEKHCKSLSVLDLAPFSGLQ